MSNTFFYFAYGSNMSHKRLQARTPSARPIGRACLHGHRLVFDKPGKTDGSAKADCQKEDGFTVWGGLYEIDEAERTALDEAEGLGKGYAEGWVDVFLDDGSTVSALIYLATKKDPNLRPYTWYLKHVLVGTKDFSLPEDYVAKIKAIDAVKDSDPEREKRELSIYL